jgi:hypothetical protein
MPWLQRPPQPSVAPHDLPAQLRMQPTSGPEPSCGASGVTPGASASSSIRSGCAPASPRASPGIVLGESKGASAEVFPGSGSEPIDVSAVGAVASTLSDETVRSNPTSRVSIPASISMPEASGGSTSSSGGRQAEANAASTNDDNDVGRKLAIGNVPKSMSLGLGPYARFSRWLAGV